MFQKMQPKAQIFWGNGDIFFTPKGGELYLTILPDADFHWLESGHFAVEDCGNYIAAEMKRFTQSKWPGRAVTRSVGIGGMCFDMPPMQHLGRPVTSLPRLVRQIMFA